MSGSESLPSPSSAIPVHFQLRCPRCGSDKFHGQGFPAVLFAKCDRCEHVWQWANRVPDTPNSVLCVKPPTATPEKSGGKA